MSNVKNNRISEVITSNQTNNFKQALQSMYNTLPFLTTVTPEERKKMPKIQRNNKLFVSDAIEVSGGNQEWLPRAFDHAELEKDFNAFKTMQMLIGDMERLLGLMKQTKTLLGSESMVAALMVYRAAQYGMISGMEGAEEAYNRLKKRFEGQGNFSSGEDEADVDLPDTDSESES